MIQDQLEMFAAPARTSKSESPNFHAAVVFLRKRGVKVIRVSNYQSLVNGCLVQNRMVAQLADSLGWRKT